MRHSFIFLFCISFLQFTNAQSNLLQSGPMVGYSDYRDVLIWVQTTSSANVKVEYVTADADKKFTETIVTTKKGDYIAKLYPSDVEYGKTYTYKLYINDIYVPRDYKLEFQTQTLWQWRKEPPDFSFAIGSCFYANEPKDDRPGEPYGGGYEIFNSILETDPDFMLWLGDNIYLRTPDFFTERGLRHRHRQTRATPELQPLLGSVHHYSTWDDHDYGPNNADGSYVNKKKSESAFNDYWGNLNTNAAGNGGISSYFLWNDVAFFMMDNRYHRDPNQKLSNKKQYLGEEQLNWLINALTSSKATFKIVCIGGQIISDAAIYENYATYPEEREELLNRLDEEKIAGVIFMSGDRHHTEISKMERPDAYPLIDITCSPLTSKTYGVSEEGNSHLLKDKTFSQRNFGVVNVTGARLDRTLVLTIYDQKGEKVWDYSIKASDVTYK